MSDSSLFDFDALVAAISEAQPCGTLRETGENTELNQAFSELRDLVTTARRIEAKRAEVATFSPEERERFLVDYEGKSDGPQADPKWERIVELSLDILSRHSKDTRVLVMMTDAALRIGGITGLGDALRVSRLMLETFGLALFPAPETADEGADTCLRALAKLEDSANIQSGLDHAPVFPDNPDLHWFSHTNAIILEKRPGEERARLIQDGVICLEDFSKEVERSGAQTLRAGEAEIAAAIHEAEQLDRLMTERSDRKNPVGISSIVDRLKKIHTWYKNLTEDRLSALNSQSDNGQAQAIETGPGLTSGAAIGGSTVTSVLVNREQAFSNLLQVAAFFRKTEPHSPVSYALEQAVRWGKMPLPDLLRDLVADSSVLGDVFRRMGIKEQSDNG